MDKTILVFGTLFAAFMAGVFSLFTLINNKEQKVSEFRQAWIDALRSEVTGLSAALYYISYYMSTRNAENKWAVNDLEDSHKQYVTCCAALLTRINAQDPDSELRKKNEAFLDVLNNIQNSFNAQNYSGAASLSRGLIDVARPVLKAEWERVKGGEKSYKRTKRLALLLCVFGLALASIFMFSNYRLSGEISVEQIIDSKSK